MVTGNRPLMAYFLLDVGGYVFLFIYFRAGDPLMHKLAAVISPKKSSFIVAHLAPREFVREMEVTVLAPDLVFLGYRTYEPLF